jgi:predicted amidohydrolase YtcJ
MLDAAPVGARRVRLDGMTLVPGFNDCHMHILGYGLKLLAADLSPDAGVRDASSLVAALRRWADANPGAPWIRGASYNQNAFPGVAHVPLADLDAAFPDRPVLIHHTSGHAAVANSAALRAAAIGPATASPSGGEIVRSASGAPTGVLLETAIGLVSDAVPPPSRADMGQAIIRACRALTAVGVTSASDMSVGGPDTAGEVGAYKDAVAEGAAVRMTLCPDATELGAPERIPCRADLEACWQLDEAPEGALGSLRMGALKLFADGALTTRTAALRSPFEDNGGLGMLLHEPDLLRAYIRAGHAAGWQLATHAIGDRAIELVLDAYASAQSDGGAPRRHRVEHCMMVDAGLMSRLRRLGVVAVVQPEFVASLGDAYVLGLGLDRASQLVPVRSFLAEGIPVAFSSDCPVVRGAPLDGIRAALRRTTPSGRVLGADQRIGPGEALAAYTTGAAHAVFDEEHTGAIAVGMRADLAVLTGWPEASEAASEVVATIVGGTVVHGMDRIG